LASTHSLRLSGCLDSQELKILFCRAAAISSVWRFSLDIVERCTLVMSSYKGERAKVLKQTLVVLLKGQVYMSFELKVSFPTTTHC